MAFLHNNKTGFKISLIQDGNKSQYGQVGDSFEGKLKPISIEDTTFDTGGMDGDIFKFTIKDKIEIKQADKVEIDGKTYIVKDVKFYDGISFDTTKILLSFK